MTTRVHLIAGAVAVAGLFVPAAGHAQSTWNLISGAGCTQNAANTGNFGNSWACSGTGTAGTSVTASAFSTQNGTSGTLQNTTASQYANAYMSSQGTSGFGVANRTEGLGATSPDHAVDNNPTGSYDMIVLNFGTDVILSQIGIGWSSISTGADITIMRWDGAGAPDSGTATVTTGGNKALTRSGWTLVSSLADVKGDNLSPYGGNARNTYADSANGSSWWMVAAFNTTLNGTTCYKDNSGNSYTEGQMIYNSSVGYNTARCDDGDDAFKLNWLQTIAPPPSSGGGSSVPEPASFALAGLALVGLVRARRRT